MDKRYAVLLNGKKIGTVQLDPERRGVIRARLAPLPSFRSVARYRHTVRTAQELEFTEKDLTPSQLAQLDGAEAVLESLELALALDDGGSLVFTDRIELLKEDPPHVRVTW